jgi:hypothetical protein
VRLLKSFGDKPVELIGNMLASMLVSAIDDVVNDPDFDKVLRAWRANPESPKPGQG